MKLHLGCGKRFLPGFIHIDIEKFDHVDFLSPMHDLHAITNASVEEIYSSHSFEYYDRVEAQKVLREWFRVMAPGGTLYLTVPNFESLLKIYVVTGKLDYIVGPLFGRWHNLNLNETIYHKTVYDKRGLWKILSEAGFMDLREFNPIEYLHNISEEYDDYSLAFYPHMDSSGIQVSLAVAATKQ